MPANGAGPGNQCVAALVDGRAYARLVRALLGHACVERAASWEELLVAIRRGVSSIVVLDLSAPLPLAPEYALRHIWESRRVARLVLLCRLDAPTMERLALLPRPVADALIVPDGHDDAAIRWRVLSRAGVPDAVRLLRRTEIGRIAAEIAPSFERCLWRLGNESEQRLSVADLARNAGRTRVQLERTFAHGAKASPKRLIGLVYALVAVALLELRQRSVACLADELGFSSPDSLRRSVRRFTGLTLAEISNRGGLMHLVNVFNATFGGGAADGASG